MWSPEQYARFAAERRQPFDDLLALVERREAMRVVDLGCGPGELTRELHETLAAVESVGVDNSDAMLVNARQFANESIRFEQDDIATFAADRPFDLIFSNAASHWVPNHEELFARLTTFLAAHGQLAVQMPANDDHAAHRIAAEVAQKFGLAPRPDHLLTPEHYATLLHRLGYKRQHVRLQVYGHVLPSASEVVEWVRGALLTYYQAQLGEQYEEFLTEYRHRLHAALGQQRNYFYTYKRLLMWATF